MTTHELLDRELLVPKNSDNKKEIPYVVGEENENHCNIVENPLHEDNAQQNARRLSANEHFEGRTLEDSVRDNDKVSRIEIHRNAQIKTEEVEKLECYKEIPMAKPKQDNEYLKFAFDESSENDPHYEIVEIDDSFPVFFSSGGSRLSLLPDHFSKQQGGTMSKIKPAVTLLATIAIASSTYGFHLFVQQISG